MAENKLVGQDYTTPDLRAKVTGRAKYAEDFRADGMLFCKLLLSPMPHARVRSIDTSRAEAMEGVAAILTPDDLPAADPYEERALTYEPVYHGEPIVAVAAVDEETAAAAIERIRLDLEPLPFVIDPLESLRPNGPNARLDGNAYEGRDVKTIKWTAEDFERAGEGKMPMGQTTEEFAIGDVESALQQSDLVIEETVYTQSTAHAPLESRTAMAYWQNGKLYLHGSTQSVARTVGAVAQWVGIEPENVVIISEYTGGGFGSKIPGSLQMAIPALLSRKVGRPVMMRITREEENYIGRGRPGMQAHYRAGFAKDGRLKAIDMFVVQDNGPYSRQGDFLSAASVTSLTYQPEAMRFRGISVMTNTPPRTSQRAPGGLQAIVMFDPLLDKAARQLGIDRVAIRRVNAPEGKAIFDRPEEDGTRRYVTAANVKEAIDRGARLFDWDARKARSGQRRGSKLSGVGVAMSSYTAGSVGFDGLMYLAPDGLLYIQQGIGNLGTHSVMDTARVAGDVLDLPGEKLVITWGNTSKHLPWSSSQGGSQTTHAHTRANHAAAMDARRKIQEIAARDLGGSPDDYELGGERVYRRGQPGRGLTLAHVAERAVQLGGKYDGHELPTDINPMTVASAKALAGKGLMGVAKDNYPRDGRSFAFVVGFAEVEVDAETGAVKVVDIAAIADCGTVLHPRSLKGQVLGGFIQGMGHTLGQKWVYDRRWGLALAKRFYTNKPPTILDVPVEPKYDVLNIPDPETPVGARGIGEAPVGAGAAAVLSAIMDAVGENAMHRTPVTPDLILSALEPESWTFNLLTAHV